MFTYRYFNSDFKRLTKTCQHLVQKQENNDDNLFFKKVISKYYLKIFFATFPAV